MYMYVYNRLIKNGLELYVWLPKCLLSTNNAAEAAARIAYPILTLLTIDSRQIVSERGIT